MSVINSFKDLIVYQKAYTLAMEIFELTKTFPKEEIAMIGINQQPKMIL
jgi:hypothetical protein